MSLRCGTLEKKKSDRVRRQNDVMTSTTAGRGPSINLTAGEHFKVVKMVGSAERTQRHRFLSIFRECQDLFALSGDRL